ncbi:MAG: VanW family protein [Bacillota bacterium]|nr:VanW family protein [Bacillota bacterium]
MFLLYWGGVLVLAIVPFLSRQEAMPAILPALAGGERSQCDPPGFPDPQLYESAPPWLIPWEADPPQELKRLLQETGAYRVVGAFRTTLLHPLLEEEHNIAEAARYLQGKVIPPGQVFSTLRAIGPFTAERGYRDGPSYVGHRVVPSLGGGVCKISTTLYNAVILAGLQVVERNPHGMPVPYVPPGRDATIAWGALDFRFKNSQPMPLVLWAQHRDRTLTIAIYGAYDPPQISWHHEIVGIVPSKDVRLPNPLLPKGEERRIGDQIPGFTVRSWVTEKWPGLPAETRFLGIDHYRPLAGIVEYGP